MPDNKLVWKTQTRIVKDLIPYAKNPRIISKHKIQYLKESLEKFGLVEIPVIDIDNTIIAGHQRLQIMVLIGKGEETIDVRVPNRKLTEEEFKEYNIRSNANVGDWDWEALKDKNWDIEELREWGLLITDIGINDTDEEWKKAGMPQFKSSNNLSPIRQIIISFKSDEDIQAFSKLIEQSITHKTISIWFPKVEIDSVKNLRV